MTGFIGVGQLRYILTNLGEKMSEEEVDELLKAVDTSSGEINYTGMFLYCCMLFDSCLQNSLLHCVNQGLIQLSAELVRTILAN